MDAAILSDVAEVRRKTTAAWVSPLLSMEQQDNPFIPPEFSDLTSNPAVLQTRVGSVLASRLNILSTPDNPTDIVRWQVSLHHLDCSFDFVEPILCTAFLYSSSQRAVLSDFWHFYPDQSQPFLKGWDAANFPSVAFEGQLRLRDRNPFFVVLLRHPASVDGSQAAIRYYLEPSPEAKQAALAVKPPCVDLWQTFAFTFWNFDTLKTTRDPLQLPLPYLFDRQYSERELGQCIQDVTIRHWSHLPFRLWMATSGLSPTKTIRLVAGHKPTSFVAPMNQLWVKFDKIALGNQAPPVFLTASLGGKHVLESKFGPCDVVKSEVVTDLNGAILADGFLVRLPFPLSRKTSIMFSLFSLDLESGAAASLGSGKLALFEPSGIFIPDRIHGIPIGDHSVSVKTFCRSNLLPTNDNLTKFLDVFPHDFSLLESVSSETLLEYLFPVLDVFVEAFSVGYKSVLDFFLKLFTNIRKVVPDQDLSDTLLRYDKYFAFPVASRPFQSPDKPLLERGVSGGPLPVKLAFFVGRFVRGLVANAESEVDAYLPFFFGLITKWLKLNTFDLASHDWFGPFVKLLSDLPGVVEVIGRFANQLFDLGSPTSAMIIFRAMTESRGNDAQILPQILTQRSFVFFVRNSAEFRSLLLELATNRKINQQFFELLADILAAYDSSLKRSLAKNLPQLLTSSGAPPRIFHFFLTFARSVPATPTTLPMINTLVGPAEVNKNIVGILDKMIPQPDLPLRDFVRVLHHLIGSATTPLLTKLLKQKRMEFVNLESPGVVRVLRSLFEVCAKSEECCAATQEFVQTLREIAGEDKVKVLVVRAASVLSHDTLKSRLLASVLGDGLVSVLRRDPKRAGDPYRAVELLFAKFEQVQESPDAQCAFLHEIAEFHSSADRLIEAASAYLMEIGIVLEFLTGLGRIPNYFHRSRPCSILYDLCAAVAILPKYIRCQDSYPVVPGFCDSIHFSSQSVFSLLFKVLEIYERRHLYDLAESLLSICWPMLEWSHAYGDLSALMERFSQFFGGATKTDTLDTFWMVLFPDNKRYVYRYLPMAKRPDFISHLIKSYSPIYEKIKVLGDTESMDAADVQNGCTFLRSACVHPSTAAGRIIRARFAHHFVFPLPFVPGGKSAQGSAAEQRERRTVWTTRLPLPNFFGRSEVVKTKVRELLPIQVAYRKLREQADKIGQAVENGDVHELQLLLAGTWATQVNAGPVEYVNVFLKDKKSTEHTQKLLEAYAGFMNASKAGLQAHGAFAGVNHAFGPIQAYMEASFQATLEALEPYFHR
jgi:hypothetical protein